MVKRITIALAFLTALLIGHPMTWAQDLEFCDVRNWRQQVQIVQFQPEEDARFLVYPGTLTGAHFLSTQTTDGRFVGDAKVKFLLPEATGIVVLVEGPPGAHLRVVLCMEGPLFRAAPRR